MYGTPVLGADIGGIPELIQVGKTGELFESGNVSELVCKLKGLYFDHITLSAYAEQCKTVDFSTIGQYVNKLQHLLED